MSEREELRREFSFENAIPNGPWYTLDTDKLLDALIETRATLAAVEADKAALTVSVREEIDRADKAIFENAALKQQLAAAQSVSAALTKQLQRVVGVHNAPADCYATGPCTGNEYFDLASCPSCEAVALLAALAPQREVHDAHT